MNKFFESEHFKTNKKYYVVGAAAAAILVVVGGVALVAHEKKQKTLKAYRKSVQMEAARNAQAARTSYALPSTLV